MFISTGNWVCKTSSSARFLAISQNSNSVEILFCETPLKWILGGNFSQKLTFYTTGNCYFNRFGAIRLVSSRFVSQNRISHVDVNTSKRKSYESAERWFNNPSL